MDGTIIPTAVALTDVLPDAIREKLYSAPDHILTDKNSIYLLLDHSVFLIPNDDAGQALVHAVVQKKRNSPECPQNISELLERIINDPEYIPDALTIRKCGIRQDKQRCVAVFRSLSPLERELSSVLSAMAPSEEEDLILSLDYQTAAFIKDLEGQSDDDMKEFTEAVIGTMESEGITGICAGIGKTCGDLSGLRKSYLEGEQAISLGLRYHKPGKVFVFAEQMLERILDMIPGEERKKIKQIYSADNPKVRMSDEMLETVRVFFQNDLNLTAASKQLFIHRNTLNYRLDKIKKEFGLDLRCFQDAVVFRIISEICAE